MIAGRDTVYPSLKHGPRTEAMQPMNVKHTDEPSKSTAQDDNVERAGPAMIKGRRLSDAEFESAIRSYAAQNGGRCPTDRELRAAGDHGLRGEIDRRGGLKRAAAQLGMKRMQARAWDRPTALAVWIAAQAVTGIDIPPKAWFEANGYSGALSHLRRSASEVPGGVANMADTAAWVAQQWKARAGTANA